MTAHVISLLNGLIETSKDGEQGFKKAAEAVTDAELKTILTTCAEDCVRTVRELQEQVHKLGGKPESKGSLSGALHRGWLNLKAAITGQNNHAILVECERSEDIAKKHYHDALQEELPMDIRILIEAQYQNVLKHHEQIRQLRNQYAVTDA